MGFESNIMSSRRVYPYQNFILIVIVSDTTDGDPTMESSIPLSAESRVLRSATSEPPRKRRKESPPASTRIMVQALGFEEIYNESIPLNELGRLIERHKYSCFRGLNYPSELIKERSVRSVGKLSYKQALKA